MTSIIGGQPNLNLDLSLIIEQITPSIATPHFVPPTRHPVITAFDAIIIILDDRHPGGQ